MLGGGGQLPSPHPFPLGLEVLVLGGQRGSEAEGQGGAGPRVPPGLCCGCLAGAGLSAPPVPVRPQPGSWGLSEGADGGRGVPGHPGASLCSSEETDADASDAPSRPPTPPPPARAPRLLVSAPFQCQAGEAVQRSDLRSRSLPCPPLSF